MCDNDGRARAEDHAPTVPGSKLTYKSLWYPLRVSLDPLEPYLVHSRIPRRFSVTEYLKKSEIYAGVPCTVITMRHSINWNIREKRKQDCFRKWDLKQIKLNVHNNHYPRTEVWYMDNALSITRLSASWKHNCRVAYPEAIKWHTVNLKHLKRCEISDNSHRTTFAILAMSSHHISVLHGAVQSHHACGNILFFSPVIFVSIHNIGEPPLEVFKWCRPFSHQICSSKTK